VSRNRLLAMGGPSRPAEDEVDEQQANHAMSTCELRSVIVDEWQSRSRSIALRRKATNDV
jgi:hypothetical protein